MPTINLLPWREEVRERRRKDFLNYVVIAVLIAGGIAFGVNTFYNGLIKGEERQSARLGDEITILDSRIEEIKELESLKQSLLDRMEVIDELQGSRPEVVHLFDELVFTLPDGIFLTSVKQSGTLLTIKGVAESSTRVSTFMKNIEESSWLDDPGLEVIQETSSGSRGSGRARNFTITAQQKATRGNAELEETVEG